MGTIIKDEGKVFHLAPAGMVQAVCFDFWDIGRQKKEFKGVTKIQHKGYLAWEIDERIKSDDDLNGKRFRLYKKYTLSLNDKASLNKDLMSWRGKPFMEIEKKGGFDIESMVGVNCFLNIVHNKVGEKTFANISTINPLPKNMSPITAENARGVPEWIAKLVLGGVGDAPEDIAEVGGDEEPTAE